ncbi:MAG TPA: hypothetical protein PLQ35_16575 [bacterium]|nr:hypothetical protein [bacterium]
MFSITGADRIGRADFGVDLGIFEARELKPVHPSFDAVFSCDNGHLYVSVTRTGVEPIPSVLYLSFGLFYGSGRDHRCGFGEIAFLSANVVGRDGDAITDVTLIPGSWYLPGYDIWGYIMVRVIDGRSSNPVSGAKVTLLGFVGGPGVSSPGYGGRPPITDATGLAYVEYPPEPSYLPLHNPDPAGTDECVPCSCIKAWLRVEPTADVSVAFDTFDTLVELRVKADAYWGDPFEEVTIIAGRPSAVEDWGLYE